MNPNFELFLFTSDPACAQTFTEAGGSGVIVDWEVRDKRRRQAGAGTEISGEIFEDLRSVRGSCAGTLICRVNAVWDGTAEEVDRAVDAGVDEVLLPMVRNVDEVEEVLSVAAGRCRVGILVETEDAVRTARELAKLPLARAFVGLNDLAIDRGLKNIFLSLVDGTVERARECFDVPFAVAGLTLPDRGHPIPCRLLIAEMVRLDCSFGILRRSFRRDTDGMDMGEAIREIERGVEETCRLGGEELESAHQRLKSLVGSLATDSGK